MKNVGIITHYDVHNHGAVLQLTALINVLARMGITAKALQFEKNYDFMGHQLKEKYSISAKSMGVYLKYLLSNGLHKTLYNIKKRNTLNGFKSKHNLIGSYYSESPQLDAVIIGSDEVFALHTGPTPVFWGHCLPTNNVISYAGSFGPTTFEDIEKLHSAAFVRSGLESMKGITVRDKNSASVVNNLLGKCPPIVVDPVILYGFVKEIAEMDKPGQRDYVLVYSYDNRMNSPEEIASIKSYAKRHNLKTLSPGFYHGWCDINVNTDPIKLLSYFQYAHTVITDTFHGAVMSIITGANVVIKTRESNFNKLSNLMAEYSLNNRLCDDFNNLDKILECSIDKDSVNAEVENRRNASMRQLEIMLKNCNI